MLEKSLIVPEKLNADFDNPKKEKKRVQHKRNDEPSEKRM